MQCCLIASTLVATPASAEGFWSQFSDPEDGRVDASRYLSENAYGFLPVPIIITDPAVDGGLGMVGLFFHETDEQREQRLDALRTADNGAQYLLTPSVSAIAGAYTGNDSWFVGGGHLGFFKQGRVRYSGGGGYGDVNLDFFGSGEVGLSRPIELNTRAGMIVQNLKFKLGKLPVFAGIVQRFVTASIKPNSLGDLSGDFLPPELQERWEEIVRNLLTQDVVTSALGGVIELDTRDNFFSPRRGYHLQLEYLLYRDFLGSDIEYELTKLYARNYWTIRDKFRTALRIDFEFADNGEALLPPFATPDITLRGIPAMRYQGNYVAVAELELGWHVDSRWTLLGFGGIGKASNKFSELGDATSRVAHGAGFRYLIASRYGLEIGLDIARGPEDTVFYIQTGTSW